MIDSRQGIRKFAELDATENRKERLIRFAVSLVIALAAAYLPAYEGLADALQTTEVKTGEMPND